MKKIFKRILIGVFILLVLLSSITYFYLKSTIGRTSGSLSISELKDKVIISRNKIGVPKIEAKNQDDMFFAIGYVHASDRLFQMDMIRRLATGRLSEIMGKRTLNIDKRYKNLMVEEAIENSLSEKLPEKIKKILINYCKGVNYFIKNETLPPEFKLLGYKPEEWKIKDVLSIFKNMENILAGSGYELGNYKITKALGTDIASKLISGTFGASIINEREYNSFFENDSLLSFASTENEQVENGVGSNNWVISGKKTSTGLPLLANDPHLSNVFPSYFYQFYATDGKIILSGNSIAGVPFVIIGRNKKIGWGFTNVGTDVIDYFILEVDEKSERYKLDDKWEKFTIIEKNIKIKGDKNYIHKIKMSKFGPVFEDNGLVFARHSIMSYKSTVLSAFYEMNFSESIIDFLGALKIFTSPAQNVVFADTLGTIGYYPTGSIPDRRKGNGSLPVKITKSTEVWNGFIDEKKKPYLINPNKGYIVTANNPVIDSGKLPVFGINWFPSFRADRIDELIKDKTNLTIEDMKEVQTDSYIKSAEYLISLIKDFNFKDKNINFILDKFKNWNYSADKGVEPILFYKFQNLLSKNIFEDDIMDKRNKNIISRSWLYRMMNYPNKNFSKEFLFLVDNKNTEINETFFDIVKKSLKETYIHYKENNKSDIIWKKQHSLYYRHPLGSVKILGSLLNRGPYFMEGGKDCILTASFSSSSFKISHLSSFRMIMDMSDFANSIMINSSGQNGNFMSMNYGDQIKLFTNLKYRKMEDFSGRLNILILNFSQ